jgi:methylated-DNA-[protein]-cysteine S-methyltransferase
MLYHELLTSGENIMRDNSRFNYCTVKSDFGGIVVVWHCADNKVVRIFLPKQRHLFRSPAYNYSGAEEVNNSYSKYLCRGIKSLLFGKRAGIALDTLDWSQAYRFQARVLLMEHKIPRGSVSTYGRLAFKLGNPRAARAVGAALARNPFPLIIPCHRTVRSDGSLGGYAGGLKMKKWLLEREKIRFDRQGRVVPDDFW